jgi:hypothetical protein
LRKKFDFKLGSLLLLISVVLFSGGCGGIGGDDGDNGDKTFSDLPVLPPAPATSGNWVDVADTSWYNEDQSSFTLTTAEQLAGIHKIDQVDLFDKTFTLANDIDLAGRMWSPVWIYSFDGGGHTVSNMTIIGNFDTAGLLSLHHDGIVKNVHLTNVYINVSSDATCNAGGIAPSIYSDSSIENCTASGVISAYAQSGYSVSGGIVGVNDGRIDNCAFSGSVFSSSADSSNPFLLDTISYAGGVTGFNQGEVLNSSSNGRVASYPYTGAAGGVVGRNEATVASCKSGSDVSAYARGPDAGGVAGENRGEVVDSSSSGSVSSYNSNNTWFASAGGIVARNYGSVQDCFKTSGRIVITNTKSQYAFAGGVIGAVSAEAETISISGNTFSRAATGQQWGIGSDFRVRSPSNDGATPID